MPRRLARSEGSNMDSRRRELSGTRLTSTSTFEAVMGLPG